MTNKEKIRDYFDRITKGMLKLSDRHLDYIIRTAREEDGISYEEANCKVILHRSYKGLYDETVKSTMVTQEQVNEVLKKHGEKGVNGFYKYDIYGPKGELIKTLYSVNSNLF